MMNPRYTFLFMLFAVLCAANMYAAQQGALVPFQTFEAEDAEYGDGARLNRWSTTRKASSEKGYIHLEKVGSYVQFNNMPAANRLTLRFGLPQNEQGTISLYINGEHNQDIFVNADHCFDTSNSSFIRAYDEVFAVVDVAAGDNIRFQRDAEDGCSWYAIDLIDLETAPEPSAMPADFYSIEDYGATPDDEIDDTEAIRACIADAAAARKSVWIPAGTFLQNTRLSVPEDVNLSGAGMWYSHIHFPVPGNTFSNDIGYALQGFTTVTNIRFTGAGFAREQSAILFRPISHDVTLENLWVQNIGCVYGWEAGNSPVYNVEARFCKIIGTYFDGFHWGDGAADNNLIENVYFRGMGDDAVAQVNRKDMPLCHSNIARFNTIVASYWGRGLANIGGDDLIFSDNIISSTYNAGLMIATEPLGPSESRPVQNFQFLRNTIRKCGHAGHNHGGIHFWLNTAGMQDVVIKDNIIEDGETKGIRIDNTDFGDEGARTIFENNISRCNAEANYDNGSDDIEPILINNDFSGCEETRVESGYNDGMINDAFSLQQNYPNPFNPVTRICYDLTAAAEVKLSVYDVNGREVKILVDGAQPQGEHAVTFHAENMASGIYLYKLCADQNIVQTKKMILLR